MISGLTRVFENMPELRNKGIRNKDFQIQNKKLTQTQLGRNEDPTNKTSFCEHRNISTKRELQTKQNGGVRSIWSKEFIFK